MTILALITMLSSYECALLYLFRIAVQVKYLQFVIEAYLYSAGSI